MQLDHHFIWTMFYSLFTTWQMFTRSCKSTKLQPLGYMMIHDVLPSGCYQKVLKRLF